MGHGGRLIQSHCWPGLKDGICMQAYGNTTFLFHCSSQSNVSQILLWIYIAGRSSQHAGSSSIALGWGARLHVCKARVWCQWWWAPDDNLSTTCLESSLFCTWPKNDHALLKECSWGALLTVGWITRYRWINRERGGPGGDLTKP